VSHTDILQHIPGSTMNIGEMFSSHVFNLDLNRAQGRAGDIFISHFPIGFVEGRNQSSVSLWLIVHLFASGAVPVFNGLHSVVTDGFRQAAPLRFLI
jgi:hypothetical protein